MIIEVKNKSHNSYTIRIQFIIRFIINSLFLSVVKQQKYKIFLLHIFFITKYLCKYFYKNLSYNSFVQSFSSILIILLYFETKIVECIHSSWTDRGMIDYVKRRDSLIVFSIRTRVRLSQLYISLIAWHNNDVQSI